MVLASALVWAAFDGRLAVARHLGLQTNAFDLGYVSQALWYDAHGQPFRFTTIQGLSQVLEGVDLTTIRHPHWLLAFHVEPALLLLAPLYRLWPDPRLLLWLQAAVLAAGALPAAWLGRAVAGGWPAGLVFGLAYLLAPALQGAALSDFHMVAVGAALLMTALWLAESGHSRWAVVCLALTALTREDAAAAVTCLALVLVIRHWRSSGGGEERGWEAALRANAGEAKASPALGKARSSVWAQLTERIRSALGAGRIASPERPPGSADAGLVRRPSVPYLLLAAGAGAWTLLCIAVIQPFFSGGASAFAGRYGWLLRDPWNIGGWLASTDVRSYLGLELLTGGIVALLAPLELAAAGPLAAVNALSSFDWMRSGGGHYSTLLVPLLIWAAARGVRRLRRWAGRPGGAAGLALVLVTALAGQAWAGASPLRPGFAWPAVNDRARRVLATLAVVPPSAAVSATSAMYPHVSGRAEAYWFPAKQHAAWFVLDMAGATHPLSFAAARDEALALLARPDVELVEARDGLLVMRRLGGASRDGLLDNDPAEHTLGEVVRRRPEALPAAFYGFVTPAGPAAPIGPVRFGTSLELVSYRLERWPDAGLLGDSITLVTNWRTIAPLTDDLRFAVATTRADGALSGIREDAAATPLWFPTSLWPPGREVRLDMPLGPLPHVQALGVMVIDRAGVRLPASGAGVTLWDGGTIAQVVRLR